MLERKAELTKRLEAIEAELGKVDMIEVTLAEVKNVLRDLAKVWDTLSLEERREVIRLLVEELRVDRKHVEIK
ncbi:MAG: hypothetical protein P4L33_11070 [Capsulimonadaceae bacterium]|nr:hypothetical protein [Capsulimonadaceae bacterium]